MGLVSGMWSVVKGAAAGVAVVTALPVLGAAGAITAAGVAVGTVVGGVAGAIDAANGKENS